MSFNQGSTGSREFVPGKGLVPSSATFVPGQGMVRTTNPPAQNTNQTYVLQPRVTEAPPPKTQEQKREPVKLVLSEKPAQPQKQDPPKTQAAQPAPTQPKAVATKSEPAKPKETPKAEPPKDDWEQADVQDEPAKPEPKQEPPKKVVTGETGKFTAEGVPIMSLGDDEDESSEEDAKGETHKEKKKRQEAEAEAQLVANDDPREHVNIVFIGHVDAGKSTISGQVLFSTGMVDLRAIEKFSKEAIEKNRESWFLAYIMDTNEEERAKGKTVEVGRAHFFTEKKRYTILDAPGHKAYVPNMMAGLAQADIGVLIISARKGEFEAGFEKSGQTREHAILAKTIGIKKLIILINKMDDQTVLWSKDRYDDISDKLGKFLRGIGFNMKADVLFLPASGLTGINIKNPVTKEICPWFEGPTLLDALDSLKPLDRMDEAPLRIPVLDKYKESGKTYILGKVETGCLKTGDDIVANPGNVALNVFQIQNEANIITIAKPGENVKIVVKCTQHEEDQIIRGTVISIPSSLCPVTAELVGQVSIFQLLEYKPIFTAGYDCVFHTGTAQEECTVTRLLDQLDPKTGQSIQKLPTFVKENKVVVAHFTLARPMCLEKLADFPQLGRFTLRDEGKTIGFGKVLATNAPIRQKRK